MSKKYDYNKSDIAAIVEEFKALSNMTALMMFVFITTTDALIMLPIFGTRKLKSSMM